MVVLRHNEDPAAMLRRHHEALRKQAVLWRTDAEGPRGVPTDYNPLMRVVDVNNTKLQGKGDHASLFLSQFWIYSTLHLPLTSTYFPALMSISPVGTT